MKYHIYNIIYICIYLCCTGDKDLYQLASTWSGCATLHLKNLQGFSHQQHHPNNCPLVFLCVMIIRKSIYILFKKQKQNIPCNIQLRHGFAKTVPLYFHTNWTQCAWLVSTHLKNFSQNWNLPQIGVKINKIKPPPSWGYLIGKAEQQTKHMTPVTSKQRISNWCSTRLPHMRRMYGPIYLHSPSKNEPFM